MFSLDDIFNSGPRGEISDVIQIKVVGVGGGGCNVVSHMSNVGVAGIQLVGINTDLPALNKSLADVKLQIGEHLTNGKGAGSDPVIGRKSAEESRTYIAKVLEGADLVFLTAGMGGGTGTGAAPVVAEVARECGALTVGVVTRPFKFEGARKSKIADEGIEELKSKVDTLIVIPNEKLREVSPEKITLANAFGIADNVLRQAVVGIADVLRSTNYINLDFADLRTILKDAGYAHIGMGEASGKNKVVGATTQAIQSPLMETSIRGARRIMIRVTGSPDLAFDDVEAVVSAVNEAASSEANIIFGVDFDEALRDALRVVIIATDFDENIGSFDYNSALEKSRQQRGQATSKPSSKREPVFEDFDDYNNDVDDGSSDWAAIDSFLSELGLDGKNRK